MGLTAVLAPGNGVEGASDPGEDGMEEAGGEEAGGEEATEDGVDVLNMSTSVRCFVFIVVYPLVVVVACVVAVLTVVVVAHGLTSIRAQTPIYRESACP